MRAFQSCCLLLALLGMCSWPAPLMAHTLGRQRSMQTTATATSGGHSQFDMPIWKAAYAGQYVEAAIERSRSANAAAQYQQQSNAQADQHAAPRSLDYQDMADLSPAALQDWLLLAAMPQADGAKLVLLNAANLPEAQPVAANEARFIKGKDDGIKIIAFGYPMPMVSNTTITSINNNNNSNIVPTTTAAPAAAAAAAAAAPVRLFYEPLPSAYRSPPALPYGMPLQYMGQRQDAAGNLAAAQFPYSMLGFGNSYAGMPLVPITLPNNEVRYVPLNWRALRQLSATATAVREDEPQTTADSADMASLAGEAATAAELNNLNMFQARPNAYRASNPFVTFAKSLRRRQYA